MESFSASVVSVPFISLGEPVVSLGSRITWQDEPSQSTPAPEAAPEAIRQNAARASAQVLAWRQAFYAFRKARARVEAGRPAEALPFLDGPHGNYVRARFAELGRTDPRFYDDFPFPKSLIANAVPAPEATPAPIPAPEPVRDTPTPTNQESADEYGRALEHFSDELAARRKVRGANGYHYQLTRDSQGRDLIERTSPNHAETARVLGNAGGYFATTSAAIAWAMDNQKSPPTRHIVEPAPEATPTAPEPVRDTPTPTNQRPEAEPTPILHVGAALADAMGMRTLPNTFILEAGAQPEDFNIGTFIKIAADSVEQLRHMDVIRLLSDAPPDHLPAVAAFLRINRPDLAGEVRDALADVLADRTAADSPTQAADPSTPAPDASPDQSTPESTPAPDAEPATPEVAPVVSGSAIVNRAAFADAVKAARRFAPARCPKPILSCVRVRTDGDDLIVEATDLESAIRIRITQVQIETPLDVCLPACKLADALDDRSDTVVLRVEGTEATIAGGSSSVKLFTHAPGEFPKIGRPDADFARWYDVPALDFTRAMDRALVFTSKEGSRYAFNGVLLSVKDSALDLVATDGRRLLQDSSILAFHGEAPDGSKLILPALVYKRVRQIVGKHPAGTIRLDVTEAEGETVLRITLPDDATVYAMALDGQFPPYEDVIPKEPESCWTFDAAEFLEAVRRGSASVCEDCKGVRMEFDADSGRVTITSRNPAAGESMAMLSTRSNRGPAITIGFNPEYLADYLKLAKSDGLASVTMELTAPNRPGLMKFQDKKTGSEVTYVLMPVNLQ